MTLEYETQLDNFDPAVRRNALGQLAEKLTGGSPQAEEPKPIVNLHAHTFFSYNPYGYSPSHFAWLAKLRGLSVAGIIEFDVLDGLDEFTAAGNLLDLRTCVGVESRVFVPEFEGREINSPGEPAISYHMGVGFTTTALPQGARTFLDGMRRSAETRNRALVDRVNAHTSPVELDYGNDVVPLTPKGNATERHICLAYARKAAAHFAAEDELASYWSDKLGVDSTELDLPDGAKLQAAIRSKTMKRGGVGYVQPDGGSFPAMADMNRFVMESGAIPTMTWLSGMTDGEKSIEELVEVAMSSGVAAVNVIPDRNFGPGVDEQQLKNLGDLVALADQKGLPVVMGTEMNSPGLKFVDDFDAPELAPFVPAFLRGCYIVYAHSVLQRACGLGYLGEWASSAFPNPKDKNSFFEEIGRALTPSREADIAGARDTDDPTAVMKMLKK